MKRCPFIIAWTKCCTLLCEIGNVSNNKTKLKFNPNKTNPKSNQIIQIKEISSYKQTKALPVLFPFKIGGKHGIFITIQTKMLQTCLKVEAKTE